MISYVSLIKSDMAQSTDPKLYGRNRSCTRQYDPVLKSNINIINGIENCNSSTNTVVSKLVSKVLEIEW